MNNLGTLGVPRRRKKPDSTIDSLVSKFSSVGFQCDAVCVRRRKIKTGLDFDWSRREGGGEASSWVYLDSPVLLVLEN